MAEVIVELSGADVIGVRANVEVEVRQYHRDFKESAEDDSTYQVVWPRILEEQPIERTQHGH
jgi:hypothetical protein